MVIHRFEVGRLTCQCGLMTVHKPEPKARRAGWPKKGQHQRELGSEESDDGEDTGTEL
jgi:hypothetical protein